MPFRHVSGAVGPWTLLPFTIPLLAQGVDMFAVAAIGGRFPATSRECPSTAGHPGPVRLEPAVDRSHDRYQLP